MRNPDKGESVLRRRKLLNKWLSSQSTLIMTTVAPQPEKFISCARLEFQYLTTDYGFCETPNNKRRYYNPVSVRYENKTTLVIVEGLSYGFDTAVELGPLPQPSGDLDKTFPLWPLAELRRPQLNQTFRETRGQLNQLPVLAILLRSSADDILRGDFTMIPYVNQTVDEFIAEKRRLEAEQDLRRIVHQASHAFWQKDYNKVIELLEPHESRLSQAPAEQLSYARRHVNR